MLNSIALSFEFFPPRTEEGMQHLLQSATSLVGYAPHFFSVTFGAGGSTREGTLNTVKHLLKTTSIPVAPHLSCIGADRVYLLDLLAHYKKLGVKRLVVLRGDLPSGMGVAAGEFQYAVELVRFIRETTGDYFYLEVAAYPEFHPQAQCAMSDIKNLKNKYEAGANSAITQYFFNADAYFYYRDDCLKQQIHMPIVPGIMPILDFRKLMRFSNSCGAEIPKWIISRFEAYGEDQVAIRAFSQELVTKLCQTLMAGGVPGLHFYTLNKAEACLPILAELNWPQCHEKIA